MTNSCSLIFINNPPNFIEQYIAIRCNYAGKLFVTYIIRYSFTSKPQINSTLRYPTYRIISKQLHFPTPTQEKSDRSNTNFFLNINPYFFNEINQNIV